MMGWALTRWRALTRYSTVYIIKSLVGKNLGFGEERGEGIPGLHLLV